MNSIFYCSRHLWPRRELSYLLLIIKSAVLGRIKVMDDPRAERLSRQGATSMEHLSGPRVIKLTFMFQAISGTNLPAASSLS
jgi:hypothetical protein